MGVRGGGTGKRGGNRSATTKSFSDERGGENSILKETDNKFSHNTEMKRWGGTRPGGPAVREDGEKPELVQT